MVRLMAEMSQLWLAPAIPPDAPARGNPVGPEGGGGSADSTVLTNVGDVPGDAVPTNTVETAGGVEVRGVVVRVADSGVRGVGETEGGVAVALAIADAVGVGVGVLVAVGVAVCVLVGVAVDVAVAVGVAVCGIVVTQPPSLSVGNACPSSSAVSTSNIRKHV